MHKSKLIVLLGPTSSGKSDLAVRIAKTCHGEVISADSRQVYRGLDLASGKVARDKGKATSDKVYIYKQVVHRMLDVASPRRQYSVAQYQRSAQKILNTLMASGRTPVVCGGTGLYIDALLSDSPIPDVPPDPKLRARLEKKSVEELFALLQKLDPRRAKTIDPRNPRRLVRALEIVIKSGQAVPLARRGSGHARSEAGSILKLGILRSPEELRRRIRARLKARLRAGMVAEVRRLHGSGISWKRFEALGLDARHVARHARGQITRAEMIEAIERESCQYARRQMTWWRRDKSIRWVRTEREALALVKDFLRIVTARCTSGTSTR